MVQIERDSIVNGYILLIRIACKRRWYCFCR